MDEVCKQIQLQVVSLRKQLSNDITTSAYMQSAGNINGKWNVGLVMMNNTRKTLEAFENFCSHYYS